VCVLESKAREQNLRVGIGHIVAISVGVEKKIRRIKHEVPAAPVLDRGADVQAIDKDGVLVESAVAV
jgi:hypothetical protein